MLIKLRCEFFVVVIVFIVFFFLFYLGSENESNVSGKMTNNKENMDLESFLVTKHSWKGKYKRILSIGTTGISTYHPDRFDETNRWSYSDVLGAAPNRTSGNVSDFLRFLNKKL